MKTRLVALVSLIALAACGSGEGSGSAASGGQASFQVEISGALDLEESGSSAMVYDMAGFTHVGMFSRGGDFQIDFNTKSTERPGTGTLELQKSNLGGWIASLDIVDESGSHTYNATSGTLEIMEVDGPRTSGRFDFEAVDDNEPGKKISVNGTFEALER